MVKRAIFYLFVFYISLSKAQPTMNYAYPLNSGQPIAFFKFNTFTLLYSQICSYNTSAGYRYKVLGLNNDKTIRFNNFVQIDAGSLIQMSSGPSFYSPTPDKGMLIVNKNGWCSMPGVSSYHGASYSKIDSLGVTAFSSSYYQDCNSAGAISSTFYYLVKGPDVVRINAQTGVVTNTINSTSSNIITSAINTKQQIVITTSTNISVVDTSGVVILNWNGSGNYSSIKAYKKHYYLLNSTKTAMEQRDSLLNILASFTLDANSKITDYSLHDDTLYTSVHNTSIGRSIISIYTTSSLTAIQSKTITIGQHKLTGLIKDSCFNFLVAENIDTLNVLYTPGNYLQYPINNCGFSSFSSLNNIIYPSDLIIKRIKTLSFNIADVPSDFTWNYCDFTYQHSVILYNNSNDTIKSFHINHPLYTVAQYKCYNGPVTAFNKDTTLTINPHDSIEFLLPLFSGKKSYPSSTNVPDVQFCYNVSLPNNKTDNNPINNSICSQEFDYIGIKENSELTNLVMIRPNPAHDHIYIESQASINSFVIYDLSGRKILSGNKINQIDISQLNSGLYFISLLLKEKTITRKFVKK